MAALNPPVARQLDQLCEHALLAILQHLPVAALCSLRATNRALRSFVDRHHLVAKRSLRCQITNVPWTHDVLGAPSNTGGHRYHVVVSHKHSGVWSTVQLRHLRPVCQAGFDRYARQEETHLQSHHWIPIFINKKHGANALPLLHDTLYRMAGGKRSGPYKEKMAMEELPKVLNGLMVSLLKASPASGASAGTLAVPARQLQAHHALLHTWIALVHSSNSLQDLVERRIAALRDRPCKTWLPDLGEFVFYIAARTSPWHDLSGPLLNELLDRNVKWLLKKHRHLAVTAGGGAPTDRDRMMCCLKTSKVSYQLVMIQAFFARHVARACTHSETEPCVPRECLGSVVDRLSNAYGQPTNATWMLIGYMWTKVHDLSPSEPMQGFRALFQALGVPCREEDETTVGLRLRDAVHRSRRKGYHSAGRKAGGAPASVRRRSRPT